jgi:hypothetical protein
MNLPPYEPFIRDHNYFILEADFGTPKFEIMSAIFNTLKLEAHNSPEYTHNPTLVYTETMDFGPGTIHRYLIITKLTSIEANIPTLDIHEIGSAIKRTVPISREPLDFTFRYQKETIDFNVTLNLAWYGHTWFLLKPTDDEN